MDNADRAADQEQIILNDQIRNACGNAGATVRDSAFECIDCDKPIPQARREVVPGCDRCIDCQELHDSIVKRYA